MELDVEVLVVDDLVSGLVLGVGVDVGEKSDFSPDRRGPESQRSAASLQ